MNLKKIIYIDTNKKNHLVLIKINKLNCYVGGLVYNNKNL